MTSHAGGGAYFCVGNVCGVFRKRANTQTQLRAAITAVETAALARHAAALNIRQLTNTHLPTGEENM
jgi:hypothetical protein